MIRSFPHFWWTMWGLWANRSFAHFFAKNEPFAQKTDEQIAPALLLSFISGTTKLKVLLFSKSRYRYRYVFWAEQKFVLFWKTGFGQLDAGPDPDVFLSSIKFHVGRITRASSPKKSCQTIRRIPVLPRCCFYWLIIYC